MIDKEDLDKLLKEFPDVEERAYKTFIAVNKKKVGWESESNYSFLKKNKYAAIWFLENHELIIKILKEYHENTNQKS